MINADPALFRIAIIGKTSRAERNRPYERFARHDPDESMPQGGL
jgi:hypothetical protein